MTRSLPAQPNLDFLKNEAKRLHRMHERQDKKICDVLRHIQRFSDAPDDEILAAEVSLTDTQFALAMDYGFVGWQALKQGVQKIQSGIAYLWSNTNKINLLRHHLDGEDDPDAIMGFDIGSSNLKMVELRKNADSTYRVENYGIEPIPANTVVDDIIVNVEAVGEAVHRLVNRANSTELKDAALAIPDSRLIQKAIEMPAELTADERWHWIANRADEYLPVPIADVAMAIEIVRTTPGNDALAEVLMVAARRELLDKGVAALETGGVRTKIIEPGSFAMCRACATGIARHDASQIIAIADFGATSTSLHVLSERGVIFSKGQLFGGVQLTNEIQRRYNLTFMDAELAKRGGLTLPDGYGPDVLLPFKEAMAHQISRTLRFFYSYTEYDAVDHIVLAGGGASIDGIAELISERLRTPTTIANPFAGMTLSGKVNATVLENYAPTLMIACGLAMRTNQRVEGD
jgi:type IV pilus assembly protein PilM